jgi:hypothetical protein
MTNKKLVKNHELYKKIRKPMPKNSLAIQPKTAYSRKKLARDMLTEIDRSD